MPTICCRPLTRGVTYSEPASVNRSLVSLTNARAVVLDEPTAALSADDSDLLLRQLAKTGAAILYISHRINEVFRACDTVHVIRNGVVVHSAPVTQTTPREVIAAMLGRMSEDSVSGSLPLPTASKDPVVR